MFLWVRAPVVPAKLTWSLTPYHMSMCLSEQDFPAKDTNLGLEDLLCHNQKHMYKAKPIYLQHIQYSEQSSYCSITLHLTWICVFFFSILQRDLRRWVMKNCYYPFFKAENGVIQNLVYLIAISMSCYTFNVHIHTHRQIHIRKC